MRISVQRGSVFKTYFFGIQRKPLSCLKISSENTCTVTHFTLNFIKNQAVHSYNTRRSKDLRLPLPRTNWGKQTFIYQAAKDWNSLPTDLKKTHFLSIFKSKLKTFLKDFG